MATKNKYSDIDLSKYSQGYRTSSVVNAAEAQKNSAESAVKNYGDFKYSNQDAYDNAMNAYLNRDEFKYDVNADALYQQLRNQAVTQGQMAMMDTMGQASSMTGGYGNSYAQTVGQQAYQGHLQNLNDAIPDLYRLALEKYTADGDRLLNNYSMLNQDRATEYGEWGDRYNQLVADRDYYADNYNNVYNRDYGMWNDNRTYDTDMYWNEYNTGYQSERDAIADQQWQKNYEESIRQYDTSLSAKSSGSGGSGGGSGVGGGSTFTPFTYSGTDKDGKSVFYRDGKKYSYERGVNPYTGTKNPDAIGEGKTFNNGYQPNNVGGDKLSKTGITDVINGVTQNVWQTSDGKKYIWDGTQNRYRIYDDSED